MGLKALPALAALVALVCCACGAGATTFVVSIKEDGPHSPCDTPHNCTLRGAAIAAQLNDTIKLTTDVLLSSGLSFPCPPTRSSVGTLRINGGNHAVSPTPNQPPHRAFGFQDWSRYQTIHISELTFTGFRSTNQQIVCQSVDGSCGDMMNPEKVNSMRPGANAKEARQAVDILPFQPTMILDNVAFFNNSAPYGIVGNWDYFSASGGNGILIKDSTFLNNSALYSSDINHGSIVHLSANSRVVDSLFDGNFFEKNLIRNPYFSAYPALFSQVKAWGNTFTGNLETGEEGAGYILNGHRSNLTVEWSTFQGNTGATLGILASDLSMTGSLLKTSGAPGYDQITSGKVNLGECSLATDGLEAFSINAMRTWNRNPTSLNITFRDGSPAAPCDMASLGMVGCDPSLPCDNLKNQDGSVSGYTCLPANY